MKASQIAAKAAVRLLLFAILFALIPLFTGSLLDKQLQGVYLYTANKWVLIFPVLLMLGFVILLVICTVKKYTRPDLNWLLVINTGMLLAYSISVFIRLQHLVN